MFRQCFFGCIGIDILDVCSVVVVVCGEVVGGKRRELVVEDRLIVVGDFVGYMGDSLDFENSLGFGGEGDGCFEGVVYVMFFKEFK